MVSRAEAQKRGAEARMALSLAEVGHFVGSGFSLNDFDQLIFLSG